MQQHHHLQNAAWTSHQPAGETSFVALHRHTPAGQSRPVTTSSGRHHNGPAQCRSDSGETTVVKGGQSLVVKLWLSY